MKNRIIAMILMTALLCVLLPQTVMFAGAYSYSGTCGENLEWTLNTTTGELIISGFGAMTDYNLIYDTPWFPYESSIQTVTISDGVTSFPETLFGSNENFSNINVSSDNTVYSSVDGVLYNKDKTQLYSCPAGKAGVLSIPDGVTTICEFAFSCCLSLTSIQIPNSVTHIEESAFYECSGLTGITIPEGVTSIGEKAFMWCSGMESITISGSVNNIEEAPFWGCTSLSNVTVSEENDVYDSRNNCNAIIKTLTNTLIGGCKATVVPESVTSIGDSAFRWCMGLENLTLPSNVTNIGSNAFQGCTGLTSITIPASVIYIGDDAFLWCDNLTDVYFNGTRAQWDAVNIGSENDCLLNATIHTEDPIVDPNIKSGICGENLTWILNTETGELRISGTGPMFDWGLEYAPWYSYRDTVQTVAVSDGVTTIGSWAFYDCENLDSVTLPEGLTEIGKCAFCFCDALAEITIPNSVTTIGDSAFSDSDLASISLPESLTSLGYLVFESCPLMTIKLPNSLENVDASSFDYCRDLMSITVDSDNPNYCSIDGVLYSKDMTMLVRCPAGRSGSFVVPDGVKTIGSSAFSTSDLSEVILPQGLTTLGNDVFWTSSLAKITFPDGVTSIPTLTFYRCNFLEEVTLPDSIKSIDSMAFDTDGLKNVYYLGTEAQWNMIAIDSDNYGLFNATIHFKEPAEDPCEDYSDIKSGSWYYSAADFVISRGLMGSTKTDALTFEPDTKVSRAMVASILYRMADSPAASYKGTFTDVANGKWFTTAIEWCAQNGLASGKGNGTFDPNGNVTRQELAVFMMKMAQYLKKDTSGRADLSKFADSASVPSWAKTYVQWAVDAGLISGKASGGKTLLAPTDNATRAEFASIIMRFVQNIAEKD